MERKTIGAVILLTALVVGVGYFGVTFMTQFSPDESGVRAGFMNPDADESIAVGSNGDIYKWEYVDDSWSFVDNADVFSNVEYVGMGGMTENWVCVNAGINGVVAHNFNDSFDVWENTTGYDSKASAISDDGYVIIDNSEPSNSDNFVYVLDANNGLAQVNKYDMSDKTGFPGSVSRTVRDIAYYDEYVFVGDIDGYLHVFEYLGGGELSYAQTVDTPLSKVGGVHKYGDYVSLTNLDVGNDVAVLEMPDDVGSGTFDTVYEKTVNNSGMSISTLLFEEYLLVGVHTDNSVLYKMDGDNLVKENEYADDEMMSMLRKVETSDGEGKIISGMSSSSDSSPYDIVSVYSYDYSSGDVVIEEDNVLESEEEDDTVYTVESVESESSDDDGSVVIVGALLGLVGLFALIMFVTEV